MKTKSNEIVRIICQCGRCHKVVPHPVVTKQLVCVCKETLNY